MSDLNGIDKEKLEDLLENLSYSWSTPESEHFNYLITNNQIAKAKKMLKEEGFNGTDQKTIMEYFDKMHNEKKEIVEIDKSELNNLKAGDDVIVFFGGTMNFTILMNDSQQKLCFLSKVKHGSVPISEAKQIWKIVKKP